MTRAFYKPRDVVPTDAEVAFAESVGLDLNFLLKSRSVVTVKDPATQITYKFSTARRKNEFTAAGQVIKLFRPVIKKKYGRDNITFRVLYEFLCERFNAGERFVDTYFEQIFEERNVYAEYADLLEMVQSDMHDEYLALYLSAPKKKDGTPNYARKLGRQIKQFRVWGDETVKSSAQRVARAIQDDIVLCLQNGIIPLRKAHVKPKTDQKRKTMDGLTLHHMFFASGQLIRHLKVYIELDIGWLA